MKKTVIIIISFLFISVTTYAQKNEDRPSINQSNGTSQKKLYTLKEVLHNYVDNGQLAGIQTAILKDNQLIHFDSYGYADIKNKIPLDSLSIFRIFSMTKPITSVALMQLYEQGKFKLEDPLHFYIPEFKTMKVYNDNNDIVTATSSIKIIDLLRHSSGISYGRSPNTNLNTKYAEANLGASKSLKEFIERLSHLPLLFEPGTNYEYGHSTEICGYLIEVLSGQPVEDYIKENVLDLLKMYNTYFQLPKEKLKHFTTGYRASENGKLEVAELPEESRFLSKPNFIRAGGGLVSTTHDYLNFCRMLLNKGTLFGNRILKPETLNIMTKDHLVPVRKHTPRLRILPGETGFGLGFSIAEKENGNVVYGWGGAVGTYFRVDPEQDLAYIMMIQLSPYRQLNLRETFQSLVNKAVIDKSNNQEVLKPILLDKSMLSCNSLEPIELKDQPNREFFQGQLYKGKEISVYMISSSTASKDFDNFSIDEFVYLSKGSMNFKPRERKALRFKAGDFISIPKGYKGSIETVGKPKYHLELSIISNKRAGKEPLSKNQLPISINTDLITGKNVKLNENGIYKNTVYSGLELEIILEAQKPRSLIIENYPKEQCIHILEGSVTIIPEHSEGYTFSVGDFFILPKGFKGVWKSDSKDIFRSIQVTAK